MTIVTSVPDTAVEAQIALCSARTWPCKNCAEMQDRIRRGAHAGQISTTEAIRLLTECGRLERLARGGYADDTDVVQIVVHIGLREQPPVPRCARTSPRSGVHREVAQLTTLHLGEPADAATIVRCTPRTDTRM